MRAAAALLVQACFACLDVGYERAPASAALPSSSCDEFLTVVCAGFAWIGDCQGTLADGWAWTDGQGHQRVLGGCQGDHVGLARVAECYMAVDAMMRHPDEHDYQAVALNRCSTYNGWPEPIL